MDRDVHITTKSVVVPANDVKPVEKFPEKRRALADKPSTKADYLCAWAVLVVDRFLPAAVRFIGGVALLGR